MLWRLLMYRGGGTDWMFRSIRNFFYEPKTPARESESVMTTATNEPTAADLAGIANVTGVADLPLQKSDRCDRCSAQAYVRATLISGLELLFCAHHFGDGQEKLRENGAHIHDERSLLQPA